jgi:hypothetical protein
VRIKRVAISPRALARLLASGPRTLIAIEHPLPGDFRVVYADYDVKAGRYTLTVESDDWPDVPPGDVPPMLDPGPTLNYIPLIGGTA